MDHTYSDTARPADASVQPPGENSPGQEAFLTAREIAPLAVDVLVEGETGAGKDVMAREIHKWSGRPGKYIAINCAAIPETIIESELFGYEAGAFTGATRAKEGKLEAAHKGTLYLDEIDSMPLASQAKLLRALQERGAERLGGSRFYGADFRVVASTKVSLPLLVAQEKFRKDLYFRLNVIKLRLPSLRATPERVLPLFEQFLQEACDRHARRVPPVAAALRKRLQENQWPGNIRELRNAAERHALGVDPFDDDEVAAILGGGGAFEPSAPPAAGEENSLRERLKSYEREVISSTLRSCGGSVTKASKLLQVPPNSLYYRMKVLGMQAEMAGAN
jgi:DNA-binding NtrC family response regulator